MTVHYKTYGFVFKKEDLNESDRVFSIFTKDYGRLEIYAKAIRKSASKLRGGIDIFSFSRIEFIQGKNRKTLTDTEVVKTSLGKISPLEKYQFLSAISEVQDQFLKGAEKDERILKLTECVSEKLGVFIKNSKKIDLLYYYFLWSFISYLGYKPEIHKCNICSSKLNPYGIYFSPNAGGVVCKKCLFGDKEAVKVSSDVIKILRLIIQNNWQVIEKLKIPENSIKLLDKISKIYKMHILSSQSFDNFKRGAMINKYDK